MSLSDFRGRVVILDFFATWCRPCKEGIPKLNHLYEKYEKQGLSVIGYSVDKGGRALVKPFVARNSMNFPVVLGEIDHAKLLGEVKVLPTTMVIDPKGRVVEVFQGVVSEDRLLAAVRPYLSAGAPPSPATAAVNRRQDGQRRFRQVWVSDNQTLQGQQGIYVHVVTDVADLPVERGVWLQLNLRAEARSAGGLAPLGQAKPLYQRVDDGSRDYFLLFVRCDQLPDCPAGGVLRAWVTILDSQLKPVEQSGELVISRPCQLAQQNR